IIMSLKGNLENESDGPQMRMVSGCFELVRFHRAFKLLRFKIATHEIMFDPLGAQRGVLLRDFAILVTFTPLFGKIF
ncbi:MAG: hypothetical protein ACFFFG_18430, partial [Candidatus Thorarchaeota archaeon]